MVAGSDALLVLADRTLAEGAMSYARFSEGDVYVYLDVAGYLRCCACLLKPESEEFRSTDAMLAHLKEHEAAGHDIPAHCIPRLEAEREENDKFILNGGEPWEWGG